MPRHCASAADTAVTWGQGGGGARTHPALCPGGHPRLSSYRDSAQTSPRKPSLLCLSTPQSFPLHALGTHLAHCTLAVGTLSPAATVNSWRGHGVWFIYFSIFSTVHNTQRTLRKWRFGHSSERMLEWSLSQRLAQTNGW